MLIQKYDAADIMNVHLIVERNTYGSGIRRYQAGCNSLCVYLGNFDRNSETLLQNIDGPKCLLQQKSLKMTHGDVVMHIVVVNASYNLKLNIHIYSEYPEETPKTVQT